MASNNAEQSFDDAAILDITADNEEDERPLLTDGDQHLLLTDDIQQNGSILSTPHVDTILIPSISRYRLTNILRVLLFIEFMTLLIIWFIGNNNF